MRSTLETVRAALTEARSRGFAEVEIRTEDDRFQARLLPLAPGVAVSAPVAEAAQGEKTAEVKSKLVGWFRADKALPKVGDTIKKGQKVAAVEALGIVTDLEADAAGEVIEILVNEGDPIQYGQAVLRLKA